MPTHSSADGIAVSAASPAPTVALRPYQAEAIEAVRGAFRNGARTPLLVMPTGAGKTVVFSSIAASAVAKGRRVLVLAHRRELVKQASAKLTAAGVAHGIIAPGFEPTGHPVQVASVQTLARRLDRPEHARFDLIIIDEAHHAVAGQWATIVAAYPDARILGVTATPERLDGKGLGVEAGGPFDAMAEGPSVAELVAGGFLVPARIFAPSGAPDLSRVVTRAGDYDVSALTQVMSDRALVGDAVAHYSRLTPGLPAVAFCVSVRHAEDVAAAFREGGWRARAVSGDMPTADRDAALAGLATGKVQVLCTCDLISEGLDVPAIGAAILLRPTKSLGLHVQQIGRGMRPAPGKDALVILDHAGNTLRHGLPTDTRRWRLNGRERHGAPSLAPVRECPQCAAVHAISDRKCPECGHEYWSEAREIEIREGQLQEIKAAEAEALRVQRLRTTSLQRLLQDATTEADLREIAAARGYKSGWVHHRLRDRSLNALTRLAG